LKHMKKIFAAITQALVLSVLLLPLAGCGCPAATSGQPVDVVFLLYVPENPMPPGGPLTEVTLRNTSDAAIVSLNASLPRTIGAPVPYIFDVSAGKPLLPGRSVTGIGRIIGPGTADNPLKIEGNLENGASFSYTRVVQGLDVPLSNTEPVQVVSVGGPLPGTDTTSPFIQVSLRNVSGDAIVVLACVLEASKTTGGATATMPYPINFDTSSASPLLPGSDITSNPVLMSGGFNEGTFFPLLICGVLKTGATFGYSKQIQITAP
jgi:hypothetical protein